jgi:hypothetical protein
LIISDRLRAAAESVYETKQVFLASPLHIISQGACLILGFTKQLMKESK